MWLEHSERSRDRHVCFVRQVVSGPRRGEASLEEVWVAYAGVGRKGMIRRFIEALKRVFKRFSVNGYDEDDWLWFLLEEDRRKQRGKG